VHFETSSETCISFSFGLFDYNSAKTSGPILTILCVEELHYILWPVLLYKCMCIIVIHTSLIGYVCDIHFLPFKVAESN
jgi:hypothetical protein